jgi:hypothetical protein
VHRVLEENFCVYGVRKAVDRPDAPNVGVGQALIGRQVLRSGISAEIAGLQPAAVVAPIVVSLCLGAR